jgi:hypothetical protein
MAQRFVLWTAIMTSQLTLTVAAFVACLSFATAAETTVTLSGVHNCCNGCAKGITEAASKIKDVTVKPGGRNVMITAKSKSAIKKAVEAILSAGYFGTMSGEDAEKSPGGSGSAALAAKPKMTKSATVSGLHLCCHTRQLFVQRRSRRGTGRQRRSRQDS